MTPKEVIAGIAERFLDKPGPNMLASEIIKKLGAAGYEIAPKDLLSCGWGVSSQRQGKCARCGASWDEHIKPQSCPADGAR